MNKRLTKSTALACGAAMLAVAALIGATPAHAFKISYQYFSEVYDPHELGYAGDDRDFWTVVLGNPFGTSKPALDKIVTDAMASTRIGKRTRFTTTPNDSARTAYRIIMLINGNTKTGYRICDYSPDRPLGPGNHNGKIEVVATYCRGSSPLTQAAGTVSASGADDPEFRQFIRQLMANLLPTQNPERPRGGADRLH